MQIHPLGVLWRRLAFIFILFYFLFFNPLTKELTDYGEQAFGRKDRGSLLVTVVYMLITVSS